MFRVVVASDALEAHDEEPVEMLWQHWRREVTHYEFCAHMKALFAAAQGFFERYNQPHERVHSMFGAIPKNFAVCT